MWNPELASFIGLTIGDFIVSLIYLVFAFLKSSNPDEFLRRMYPLVIFIVFRTSTNYYFGVYVAGIILIVSSLIALHFPKEIEISKLFIILASMLISSAAVYYIIPKKILGEQTIPLEPPVIPFGIIGAFLISIFTLYSYIYTRKYKENEKNFKLGLAYSSYLGIVILIAYITDNISHLVYGLAIMVFAVILALFNENREINSLVFSSGFLLALDDIIGYNKYPQYAPFSRIVNLLIAPTLFIILTIVFLSLNRETSRIRRLLKMLRI